jgi:hypothetical protein
MAACTWRWALSLVIQVAGVLVLAAAGTHALASTCGAAVGVSYSTTVQNHRTYLIRVVKDVVSAIDLHNQRQNTTGNERISTYGRQHSPQLDANHRLGLAGRHPCPGPASPSRLQI